MPRDAFADPRQLERFWGPPFMPATFTRHDMKVGGRAEYFLTGSTCPDTALKLIAELDHSNDDTKPQQSPRGTS